DVVQVAEHGIQIEDDRMQYLLAAKGQKLRGERDGTMSSLANLLDASPGGIRKGKPLQQQLTLTENHSQKIVEIVSDAARQPADSIESLGLQQLLLEKLTLSDVLICALISHEPAVLVDRPSVDRHPHFAPVLAIHLTLKTANAAFLLYQGLELPPLLRFDVQLSGNVAHRRRNFLRRVVAQHARQGWVHDDVLPLGRRPEDSDNCLLKNRAVVLLGLPKRLLRFPLFADIDDDTGDADQLTPHELRPAGVSAPMHKASFIHEPKLARLQVPGEYLRQTVVQQLPIVGMNELNKRFAGHLVRAVTRQAFDGRADVGHLTFDVEAEDNLIQVLYKVAIIVRGAPELHIPLPAFHGNCRQSRRRLEHFNFRGGRLSRLGVVHGERTQNFAIVRTKRSRPAGS